MTNSLSSNANFHSNPSFIIHESCYVYIILPHIHVPHHTFIPHQNRSSKNKQTSNHNTVSPSTSLRLRGLAQARQSRSGETVSLRQVPLRQGEGSKRKQESNAGSRLGETPLAWASCLLAQKFERVAWATFRTN